MTALADVRLTDADRTALDAATGWPPSNRGLYSVAEAIVAARVAEATADLQASLAAEAIAVVESVEWHHFGEDDWAGGMEHAKDDIIYALRAALTGTATPEKNKRGNT